MKRQKKSKVTRANRKQPTVTMLAIDKKSGEVIHRVQGKSEAQTHEIRRALYRVLVQKLGRKVSFKISA